jgi:hypothetical protein
VLGLIETKQQPAAGRTFLQRGNVQHIRLTEIGAAVVDRTWSELADGRRIRWPEVLEAVRRRVRLRGIQLVREFAANVRRRHGYSALFNSCAVPDHVLDALKHPRKPDA